MTASLTEKMRIVLETVLDIHNADDESLAVLATLEALRKLGYREVMISCLVEEHGQRIVRANPEMTFGSRWAAIAPETKRSFDCATDVLPLVLRRGKSRFIPDSRRDPQGETDFELCARVNLISQYVMPVATTTMKIGTIQIDMGELSTEPTDECRILDALAAHLSIAIERLRTREQLEAATQDLHNQTKVVVFEAAAARIMHELTHRISDYMDRLNAAKRIRTNNSALDFLDYTGKQVVEWVTALKANVRGLSEGEAAVVHDVDRIAQGVIDTWYAKAEARRCKLRYFSATPGTKILVPLGAVRELLSCLLLNSMGAHARNIWIEGSRVLRVSDPQESAQPFAEIIVADDGDGIPKDAIRSINQFGWTSKAKHGFGMGLTIVDLLAKSMGGWYELRSPGRTVGDPRTEFAVMLPHATANNGANS